ncbi:MAG: flagellar outer dynein arm light chain 6 [Trebouxia sp. A1-2]|nr:MAG: flagellar outer dynein arm light chain 6 [Trebouxia sp. A1-2]
MADVEQQEQGEKPLTTADLLKSHSVKVIESHMASSYEESAVEVCLEAVHKYKHYKDIASHVKHQFDKKYPGSGKATEGVFHCVCGKNFASEYGMQTVTLTDLMLLDSPPGSV